MSQVSAEQMAKVQTISRGWNVEGDISAAAILSTGSRIPGGQSAQIRVIKQPIYHHVNHAAAAEIRFFNENIGTGITNVNQGQVPAQQVFALENIGIDLVTGTNRDGSSLAIPNFQQAAVTAAAVLEQKRVIMETASFELKVGNEVIFECCDLTLLAYGGGLDVAAGIAATTGSFAYATNGAPFAGNRRPFGDAPHLIPAGQQISARVIIPSATVATLPSSATAFWKLVLFGTQFRK